MKKKQEFSIRQDISSGKRYYHLHIVWVNGKGTHSYHATRDEADIMASKVLATRSTFGSVSGLVIKEEIGTIPSANPHGII